MDSRIRMIVIGAAIAALVAVSSAWLASGDPDGLERVAEDEGFIETARDPGYEILPDYTVPGIDGELSTAIAGLIGVSLMLLIGLGAGRLLARRREGTSSGNG
ncbi:MAG: PDGLE domain-containing protein [Chloroflexi bacterium]|nr:PDGLE domain-containing protein [Chloroflexota bacterium]